MQIKIFSIPVIGGESQNEDLNKFLRSKKVLQVQHEVVQQQGGVYWSFMVKYLDPHIDIEKDRERIDYKQELEPAAFERFVRYREIRKKIAAEEGLAAFHIFTDRELSELAKIVPLTEAAIRDTKGIGEKKVEKYARFFVEKPAENEAPGSPDGKNS